MRPIQKKIVNLGLFHEHDKDGGRSATWGTQIGWGRGGAQSLVMTTPPPKRGWYLGSHNAKITLERTALFVTMKSRWPSPSISCHCWVQKFTVSCTEHPSTWKINSADIFKSGIMQISFSELLCGTNSLMYTMPLMKHVWRIVTENCVWRKILKCCTWRLILKHCAWRVISKHCVRRNISKIGKLCLAEDFEMWCLTPDFETLRLTCDLKSCIWRASGAMFWNHTSGARYQNHAPYVLFCVHASQVQYESGYVPFVHCGNN